MIYSFQNFRLDIDRRELVRDGKAISLRPKVFAVLLMLIRQPDKVITKAEILDTVWPRRFISEATLNSCIKELRKLISDQGAEKKIIRTVHGVGFRFLADVSEVKESESALTPTDDLPPPIEPNIPDTKNAVSESVLPISESHAEKKDVSILRFCFQYLEHPDPETTHESQQGSKQEALAVIEQYHGVVAQHYSDGGLAVFSGKAGLEDHARRAVATASHLVQSQKQGSFAGAQLLQCGVASGLAIIDSPNDVSGNTLAISGPVVKHAEELYSQAPENSCIFSKATYDLVRADVRASPLSFPQDSWLLTSSVERRAGVSRRFRRSYAPLVGRDQELAILRQKLDQAESGVGQCVVLSGAAGIGKTRLLSEFATNLATDAEFIELHCSPERYSNPYGLLEALIVQLAEIVVADRALQKTEKLRDLAYRLGSDAEQASLAWSQLLGLPADAGKQGFDSPAVWQEKIEKFCRNILNSFERNILLILEDVHWLDQSSQHWLESLVARLGSHSIMLVLSSRLEAQADWTINLSCTRVVIEPLTPKDCLNLLRALPQSDAIALKHQDIIAKSAGNPFFLGELALHARDARDTRESIPNSVNTVVVARIDNLSLADKELLQIAATLGEESPLAIIQTVMNRDRRSIDAAILRLQSEELLFLEERLGESTVRFKHRLIQTITYSTLMKQRRKAAHHYVATALENEMPELAGTHPELLAMHFEKAGEFDTARAYWQRAAQKANTRLAYAEALRCTSTALKLLPEPSQANQMQKESELALRQIQCVALLATEGYDSDQINQAFSATKALCEELSDPIALFQILLEERNIHSITGNRGAVSRVNRSLLAVSRRTGSVNLRLQALFSYSSQLLQLDRFATAERCLLQCMTLLDAQDQAVFQNLELRARVCSLLAWLYIHWAQEPRALHFAKISFEAAEISQVTFVRANTLAIAAELHRLRGDYKQALGCARASIDLTGTEKLPFWLASVKITLGWAMCFEEQDRQGIAIICDTIAEFETRGIRVRISDFLAVLADAYLHFSDLDAAGAALERAYEWDKTLGTKVSAAAISRVAAKLDAQSGH